MLHLEKWLIERFKSGDKSAFETIFKSYYEELHTYAVGLTGEMEASEDLAEELFIWLWENRKSIRTDTSLKSYLLKIIHNRCLNYLKHQKVKQRYLLNNQRQIKLEEELQNDYIEFYRCYADTSDMYDKVSKEIENLPEKCQQIFIMNRFEGLKYKQIAEKLNLSISTVKNQMSIAIKKLKDGLEKYK